jgi:hypothetical protein
MTLEAILIILVVGAVAGWLAGLIVRGAGFGLIGDIIVGVHRRMVVSPSRSSHHERDDWRHHSRHHRCGHSAARGPVDQARLNLAAVRSASFNSAGDAGLRR